MTKTTNATESPKRFWSEVSIKFVTVSFLFLVSVFLFAFITHETLYEKEELFDAAVSDFLLGYMNDTIVRFMHMVTFFGSHWFLIPAYVQDFVLDLPG